MVKVYDGRRAKRWIPGLVEKTDELKNGAGRAATLGRKLGKGSWYSPTDLSVSDLALSTGRSKSLAWQAKRSVGLVYSTGLYYTYLRVR
jgi:hypothetical protein